MIDVLIQTHNEELNLPHALESVAGWARRVFVVDSGSTDGTRAIAERYGATFVHHDWEGYAAQKNWALANLPFEADWILILDADEAVTPELRDEILAIARRPLDQVGDVGFYLNRLLYFMGRAIRHCGYFPSWNLRLFQRGKARYEERTVHEHMIVDGSSGKLTNLLLHEDRRGMEHFLAKHNRYSTLESREVFKADHKWPGLKTVIANEMARRRFLKTRVLPKLPLPWLWKFLYMYVVRMGFLDGRAGMHLCLLIATYELFIQAKMADLKRLGVSRRAVADGPALTAGIRGAALSVAEGQMRLSEALRPGVALAETIIPLQPVKPETESAPLNAADISEPTRGANALTSKVPVSVLIPTLNEARNLPRCLDHLQWADEVVVVDSRSRDNTRAIAEAYGASVVEFIWDGKWPKKKNWALQNIALRNDWILIVDADEWITPALASEIAQAVRNPRGNVGFYVNRKFIFMGGWIKHCGYYPSWNLRLIRRGCGEYERMTDVGDTGSGDNEVHEHVLANGPVQYLKSDMLHFAFPNIHTFVEKHNRYSNWEAAVDFKGTFERSDAVTTNRALTWRRRLKSWSRHLPLRPTLRFVYSYFIQRGFLDGRPGFIFCRLLALYEFLSVAKYHEMKRAHEGQAETSARELGALPARVTEQIASGGSA